MKGLSTLVLLSSVVLLCSAAPALEPVTCSEDGATAARLAMHHINNHHEHGYKFRLLEVKSSQIDKTDTGCNMELTLDLMETDCHHVNPKHFEDCEFRPETSGAVMATCTVKMTLVMSDATVSSYTCTTNKALTNQELMMTCPDCPVLIALNDTDGLRAAHAAVEEFNKNTSNSHIFVLKELGRTLLGYVPSIGMQYYSEVILQESKCPMGSRIVHSACIPMCAERAQHALCKSSYSKAGGISRLDCEYYPAVITEPAGPGEVCLSATGPPRGHPDPPGPPHGHPDPPGPPGRRPGCPPDHVGPPGSCPDHVGPPGRCVDNVGPPGSCPHHVGPPVPPGPVKPFPGGLSPRQPPMHHCHTNPGLPFHPICNWPA